MDVALIIGLLIAADVWWELRRRGRRRGRRRLSAQYKAYMASPEWRRKARDVKLQRGWRCERCGARGRRKGVRGGVILHAHHVRYTSFMREETTVPPYADIEVLCERHHKLAHRKRRWRAAPSYVRR